MNFTSVSAELNIFSMHYFLSIFSPHTSSHFSLETITEPNMQVPPNQNNNWWSAKRLKSTSTISNMKPDRQPTEMQIFQWSTPNQDNVYHTLVTYNVKWFYLYCRISHAVQKNIFKIFSLFCNATRNGSFIWQRTDRFIALIELPNIVYQYLQSQFKGSIHLILLWADRGSDW